MDDQRGALELGKRTDRINLADALQEARGDRMAAVLARAIRTLNGF